jgi:hypothetical protein
MDEVMSKICSSLKTGEKLTASAIITEMGLLIEGSKEKKFRLKLNKYVSYCQHHAKNQFN